MDNKIVIIKATTIAIMLSCVMTVLTTITANKILGYNIELILWHYSAGIIFLAALSVHLFLMRRRFVRLFKSMYYIATKKEYAFACESQLLPNALKKKSLQEICDFFDVDKATIMPILLQKKIYRCDLDNTIENIATENNYDVSKIFTMILERHTWNAFTTKGSFSV
ncbi:MAG: hypothetical protein PHI79_02280 [Sulfurovaceae bacterium]|jgi:hypothetical protein|nr:hypothetical protein [Sulfurovaceae bacterium]MDD5548404.1 hypothetical protein [Sulfurovaceae bacterium]